MQVQSTYRYAKISAFKAREVTKEIQGLAATDALSLLQFTPKKAAVLIIKTLKSAIANAENNNNLRTESLVIQEAVVGEGPTLKRFRPKARGSAGAIRKRSSHIKITLTDEIEIKRREPKGTKKKTKGASPAKSPKAEKAEPAPAAAPAPATPVVAEETKS
jgi:large subunit ribosomal protein L22